MSARRIITAFLIKLIVLYAAGQCAWPVISRSYAAAFRSAANVALGSFGPSARVTFLPMIAREGRLDTTVRIRNIRASKAAAQDLSVRFIAYTPTIAMMALVLATPLPARRRAAALGWGLAAIHLFILLRVLLLLLCAFNDPAALGIIDVWAPIGGAMSFLNEVLTVSLIGTYLVPILAWIAVALRPGDLEAMGVSVRSRSQAAPSHQPEM